MKDKYGKLLDCLRFAIVLSLFFLCCFIQKCCFANYQCSEISAVLQTSLCSWQEYVNIQN